MFFYFATQILEFPQLKADNGQLVDMFKTESLSIELLKNTMTICRP